MPQPSKIPLAFAASGDKNLIPESTETTGLASWREGFPAITSAPFSEGGIAPKRADFNGIFNALSQAVMWLQQGGVYAYDVNTDYEAGNVVIDAGGLYVANAGNGPSSTVVQPSSDTTGATWKFVRLDLATQSAAGYMSAEDKTRLDSVILTNATQSAAGYMSAEDKDKLDQITVAQQTPNFDTNNVIVGASTYIFCATYGKLCVFAGALETKNNIAPWQRVSVVADMPQIYAQCQTGVIDSASYRDCMLTSNETSLYIDTWSLDIPANTIMHFWGAYLCV